MNARLSSSQQMETDKLILARRAHPILKSFHKPLPVKHLASKDQLDCDSENLTEKDEFSNVNNAPKPEPEPARHKKQVRRRLHTSRPYQERLLNMAEARREIVTALKFHRASMKQQESAINLDLQSPQEKKQKSHQIHSLYPSTAATTAAATANNSYPSLSCPPPYWPPPPLSYHENQDFILPSQPLGLNLNFHNFSNLETNLYQKPLSIYSASSSSSSVPSGEKPVSNSSGGLQHPAMDDEEMEEIRSVGEQHQTEWNDTVNLVTSARWCSFLKTMEIEEDEGDEYNGFNRLDQEMEFPPWLINSNETSCFQQNFDDHFSDAYSQDPVLPCMDIGEIEAMDGEWLA